MSIPVTSFAGQNWIITPSALAVNEAKPGSIADQKWLVTLTGVCVIDLPGNNPGDWRRETLTIMPDINAPLQYAITQHSIPMPRERLAALNLELWAPFAAISSTLDKDTNATDAGFAVDVWRPHHFEPTTDPNGRPLTQVFGGIDVDVAVRNNKAVIHRVSYHITLLGKIVSVPPMQ